MKRAILWLTAVIILAAVTAGCSPGNTKNLTGYHPTTGKVHK